jgi:hypothetical protein
LEVKTSVIEGTAGGPLVRFMRGAMAMIGVNKSDEATRALIRRVVVANRARDARIAANRARDARIAANRAQDARIAAMAKLEE